MSIQENMLDASMRPNHTETREVGQVAGNMALRMGDLVTYGINPAERGFTLRDSEIGRVVKLYENRGVRYAKVAFGLKTLNYPIDAWRLVGSR